MGIEQIRLLKQAAGAKVRTSFINQKSDKRKVEEKEYLIIKAEVLKENPICQWPGCNKKSVDCHHSGGRVGKNYLDKKKMKALCRGHHVFAELNPKIAKEMQISKSRIIKQYS